MAVSLRSAWLISRACRPICASPISPSSSERGTSAATESTTSTSTAPERISTSAISSACSPLSGCETSRLSMSTPSLLRVDGVERVLGVDEGGHAAAALGLGDHVQRERRLARGLRAVDLDDAAAGQAADAERGVERERAGGDGGDVDLLPAAEAHDRALAELLVDLGEGGLDRLASAPASPRPSSLSPVPCSGERSGSSPRESVRERS